MKINELEKLENEGVEQLPSEERRKFLKFGMVVTGVFLGGTVLSLTSTRTAGAMSGPVPEAGKFPYSPHYTMVIRGNRCVGCELCKEACVTTNNVPSYGYRTTILEKKRKIANEAVETAFMPVLCNQCNRPPCVRVCPTTATYKDKTTGIVRMHYKRCIGCKTCMAACPYNARYFKEENRAVDKCNFCWDTRLSKGETTTACAEACPGDVRIFGDLTDPKSDAYKLLYARDKVAWVLRPETGAMPNIYYMND
ncbi:MAG: 4Fe-4S dicluster domain-containing protein [Desulfobulbaceae bacterium]|uniref:4Fe-4S dicluster domain-containing protein n=1 Tax=Candidatus Desulfatifera sulfidica TaxID=2841691 RepID=A0A8J6TD70_9BACT|nr:4Fe-4S dicluster domain-containing protein [Candidatus Desulfatifera sulfidica]